MTYGTGKYTGLVEPAIADHFTAGKAKEKPNRVKKHTTNCITTKYGIICQYFHPYAWKALFVAGSLRHTAFLKLYRKLAASIVNSQ